MCCSRFSLFNASILCMCFFGWFFPLRKTKTITFPQFMLLSWMFLYRNFRLQHISLALSLGAGPTKLQICRSSPVVLFNRNTIFFGLEFQSRALIYHFYEIFSLFLASRNKSMMRDYTFRPSWEEFVFSHLTFSRRHIPCFLCSAFFIIAMR